MLAGNFKIHKDHVYTSQGIDVLKGAAIYGANGAGKSNFIKALAFLKETLLSGKLDAPPIKHKASEASLLKPTTFELEFATEKSTYSYGLYLDHHRVVEEWLVKLHPNEKDEIIFERKINDGIQSLELPDRYLATDEDQFRDASPRGSGVQDFRLRLGNCQLSARHRVGQGQVLEEALAIKNTNIVCDVSLPPCNPAWCTKILQNWGETTPGG